MGATDKQRNLFLKGFKLSNQGENEDPTYLGFKVVFDFGSLPIGADDGLPPSPLLRNENYVTDGANNAFAASNPFSQPLYSQRGSGVLFYSAKKYLEQREGSYLNGSKRSQMLAQFVQNLKDLSSNYPWFLQSIDGLDQLAKVSRPGYQSETGDYNTFSPQRTQGKVLTFKTLESLNLRMTALSELYEQATFDFDNMRELLPRNLRRFTMYIFVTEIRNFFKTSRLIGSSTTLQTIDNFSSLLASGNNPGSDVATDVAKDQNQTFNTNSNSPSNIFNSFVGNTLDAAGLDNDFSLLRNQQDQSGIKPVIVFECKNCEFDFTDSTPITPTISQGSSSAEPTVQSFKIHVGKVRTRSQFPNIRQDGKPLILADGWDGSRSSVEMINEKDTADLLSIGGSLLTNFIGNSLNDLINEGVANLSNKLSGVNQAMMGNVYSFDTSSLIRPSFNSAQDFLDGLGNVNKSNPLPNPKTMGLGGPPERTYPKPEGDSYPGVPGKDLGVPERVYEKPEGDSYPGVPGKDLGVPERVYPSVNEDVYSDVPGKDLGVPERVYPSVTEDVYQDVPGKDLGVPERVYPNPTEDVYADVPGRDLGVPQRVYPVVTEDVYQEVPGKDLGVPQRAYPDIKEDSYPDVPGRDLGVPNRRYDTISEKVYQSSTSTNPTLNDSVYSDVEQSNSRMNSNERVYEKERYGYFNDELRSSYNSFKELPKDVYQKEIMRPVGNLGRAYPETREDFIVEAPVNLGNAKPPSKYNISEDGFNREEKDFE